MTSLWEDFETAIAAQVATETAFDEVKTVAAAGFANPTGVAQATIQFVKATKADSKGIASSMYLQFHVEFFVWIKARLASADIGGARLGAGGVYQLADKLRAKLLGFMPTGIANANVVIPCTVASEELTDLEAGIAGIVCEYVCDLTVHNLVQ